MPKRLKKKSPKRVKKKRRLRRAILLIVAACFLLTWLPVLALRWLDPPTTAFMLETASRLHEETGQSVKLQHMTVDYRQVAPPMRLAVVASEDQTFPTNDGFDFKAIGEAIAHNARGGTLHGASTITQQVAKNLFLWPARSYFRKAIGAYFTVLIELTWPKQRILEMYLNIAQFGPGIFGVEAAAEHYFDRPASRLTRGQAALLAATLPDPDDDDPTHPSAYLLHRQDWILKQMSNLGSDYLAGVLNVER
jgi:monofunctional biosynthetic peptidoglycan transglycosylase